MEAYMGHCLWKDPKRLKGQIKGQTEKKKSETLRFQTSQWQREKDSNPHIRSQSPLCYHYTIPLCSLDEHLLLYQRFCICQELIANFPDFFHFGRRGLFSTCVSAAEVLGRRGQEAASARGAARSPDKSRGRRETGARLGCFGGRKIRFFFGFGENADSLLRFKLLYCIHQGFREEHRP